MMRRWLSDQPIKDFSKLAEMDFYAEIGGKTWDLDKKMKYAAGLCRNSKPGPQKVRPVYFSMVKSGE